MSSHKFWKNRKRSKTMKAGKIVLIMAGVVLIAFLLGYFIMLLWNETLTAIFDIPTVTYWQAIGLFILAKVFFGFGGGGHKGHSKHNGKRKQQHTDESEDESQIASRESFKEFWQEEGKQAYETFLATRKGDSDNQAKESDV